METTTSSGGPLLLPWGRLDETDDRVEIHSVEDQSAGSQEVEAFRSSHGSRHDETRPESNPPLSKTARVHRTTGSIMP